MSEHRPPARGVSDDAADRQRLGERLRVAREYLGYSQEDVANHLGIPRSALSHIESGQRRVEVLELKKLAQLYEKPVGYFTGDEPLPAPELPQDVAHLARQARELSTQDREELTRFAEYLRARSRSSRE